MSLPKTVIAAALTALVMLTVSPAHARPAAPAKPALPRPSTGTNWNGTVTRSAEDGYILGNPAAPLRVVAYISYSCPHCAEFAAQAEVQLRIGMIGPGKGSYEIRPFLRNDIDIAATLLAECGQPAKFFGNSQLLLSRQNQWLALLDTLTQAQQDRWNGLDFGSRMRAIASDLGFYAVLESRGYDRPELDRCLTSEAQAKRLAARTKQAVTRDFVAGTPAFLINGVPLAGTYNWATLKPQIEARLR